MTDSRTLALFEFLSTHREYPLQVQLGYRRATLLPFQTVEDKAYALLHSCYYTQRGAKLNLAKTFFRDLAINPSALSSFHTFGSHLKVEAPTYQALHEKLCKKTDKDGWGPKTAALFLKNIYQLRHATTGHADGLYCWHDAPDLVDDDRLFLPVDAIITKIFTWIQPNFTKFDTINSYIAQCTRQPADLEVWDDLWFWGFLTQQSQSEKMGGKRDWVCFNEGKYCSILHAPKAAVDLVKIKALCREFLNTLQVDLNCQNDI